MIHAVPDPEDECGITQDLYCSICASQLTLVWIEAQIKLRLTLTPVDVVDILEERREK